MDSQITFEDISITLQQLHLEVYVGNSSIGNLALLSRSTFQLFKNYINNYCSFTFDIWDKLEFNCENYTPKKIGCNNWNNHSEFQKWFARLPSHITHLHVGNHFNMHNDNLGSYYYIDGWHTFNEPLSTLPTTLQVLRICGSSFNRSLDNLPRNLQRLTIVSTSFKQQVDNLPTTLKYFCLYTEKELAAFSVDHLPQGLRQFMFSIPTVKPTAIDNLPPQLTHLEISSFVSHCHNLPLSLTHLITCYKEVDYLPPSLTHLTLTYLPADSADNLPTTLTHLSLHFHCCNIDHLPSSLTHLKLAFAPPNIDYLPHSLRYLSISEGYINYNICDHLPPYLTHLHLGGEFNAPVDNLPPCLTHLSLGDYFNQPIDHLPASLLSLKLGYGFTHTVDNLPQSLRYLCLGCKYLVTTNYLSPLTTIEVLNM